MKNLRYSLMAVAFLCTALLQAQKQYTVDGQSYSLQTEVEGPLTLLWNIIGDEYRYFSMKGNEILELKNTRSTDGYQEEYKDVLRLQTGDASVDVSKVKLTLGSLRKFFRNYNKQVDPNYNDGTTSIDLKTRLGVFAGITNNSFADNPDNTLLPQAGAEFEVIDEVKLKRHSLVVRLNQVFKSSDYQFSSTDVSLNYRFKFIKSDKVDIYVNAKFFSYTYVDRELTVVEDGVARIEEISGGNFNSPTSFGVGADIPVGNGYVTILYNDIAGFGLDSNGEFPVDFSAGYKFRL